MDSCNYPRLSLTARIHTLLTQWIADHSAEWRARIASVLPIFEAAILNQAESDEELSNPQLLESHLLTVLCHFEAGNGSFLLQGSSPVYRPVQACRRPPTSPASDRLSPSFWSVSDQSASENRATHDKAAMETPARGRLTVSQQSFASSSSSSSTETIFSRPESMDTSQRTTCNSTELSTNKHAEHARSKIVQRVAGMFTKNRSNIKPVCLKEGHGSTGRAAEVVQAVDMDMDDTTEIGAMNDHHNGRRMRRTLGGLLELNIISRHGTIAAEATDHVGCMLDLPINEMERLATVHSSPWLEPKHLITCDNKGQHQEDHSTANMFLHSNEAMEPASLIHNTTSAAAPRCIETRASSSGLPAMASASPLSGNSDHGAASEAGMIRGNRLPLRSFLADREDDMGLQVSCSSEEGEQPWPEEETEEMMDGRCCVCMVGFKGAAFVPCGHTFCRKCSRELWRGRGTCPLCNKLITDILDIY